jgi:prolyl-tRNA synthetase
VNYGRDFECEKLGDIAEAEDGFLTEDGSQKLTLKHGIEVGNIFQLGYHYTNLMKDATFVDEDGQSKPYYMGCYGIGLGRTMATIVEQYHDDRGMVWPKNIAPYQAHLVGLNTQEPSTKKQTELVYEQLIGAGVEVLWDDREESPGVKFADADLIGIPVRLVVSSRNGDKIEWKERGNERVELLETGEVLERLIQI